MRQTEGKRREIRSVCIAGGGVTGMGILRSFAAGFDCRLLSRAPAAAASRPGKAGPEEAGLS